MLSRSLAFKVALSSWEPPFFLLFFFICLFEFEFVEFVEFEFWSSHLHTFFVEEFERHYHFFFFMVLLQHHPYPPTFYASHSLLFNMVKFWVCRNIRLIAQSCFKVLFSCQLWFILKISGSTVCGQVVGRDLSGFALQNFLQQLISFATFDQFLLHPASSSLTEESSCRLWI